MDLDHGLHIQDQIQAMGSQSAVADPLSAPPAAGVVAALSHAVAGQSGDQEHGFAADIVVLLAIDVDHIQGSAVLAHIVIQEVGFIAPLVKLGLVVGALGIDGVSIHVNGNAVLLAVTVGQGHIEANLAGHRIQALAQVVGVGVAEFIIGAVLLQCLVLAGGPVVIGVGKTVLIGVVLGSFLAGVNAGDGVLGHGVAVAFGAVGILGLGLGSGCVVLNIDMGQIVVGLEVHIAPVDAAAIALLGAHTGGGAGVSSLVGVVGFHSFVVGFHSQVVDVHFRVEIVDLLIVGFHSCQVSGILVRTQIGVLTGMGFQLCGLLQQILVLLCQGCMAAENLQGVLIDVQLLVGIAHSTDILSSVGMEVVFQRVILILDGIVLVFHALVVVGYIDVNGVLGFVGFVYLIKVFLGLIVVFLGLQVVLVGLFIQLILNDILPVLLQLVLVILIRGLVLGHGLLVLLVQRIVLLILGAVLFILGIILLILLVGHTVLLHGL